MLFGIGVFGIAWAFTGQCVNGQANPDVGVGITRIVIAERRPAFGGASFGNAGPYEMLTGTAYGELDPKAPTNTGIVNLQYAPVNDKGHVEYSMDINILKPVDMSKANSRIIYDVLNRGHENALWGLNLSKLSPACAANPQCVGTEPADISDPGTAFVMKRGYTVVWSGWQGERSDRAPGLLKAHFPIAVSNGKPIAGISREEITGVPHGFSFAKVLTYPTTNFDPAAASLTVREREEDPRQPLPPFSWIYLDAKQVRIKTAPGFDTEALYELIYPATGAVVEGIAYASIRDFVLFLRYAEQDLKGQPNPVHTATPFKAVLAMGNGLVLKDFLYQDFNVGSSGRMVFDGIMAAFSGSSRSFVNSEFAQPDRFARQHEDHLFPGDQFPFTYATTKDPISGKTDGLLAKCTQSRSCPKILHFDTDTELWQVRASLVLTDSSGKTVAIPDNVRIYVATGVPHNSNELAGPSAGTPERGICKQLRNPLQYRYYLRALFVALDNWITEGVEPPPSRYPNLKDGTLISVAQAAKLWPAILSAPFSPAINKIRLTDYSKQPPAVSGPEYPIFVARTDPDGNPIAGVEPPEITVPIGTYSGRNIRAAGFAEGDLCDRSGSYIPFAATAKERVSSNDPRPSLEERYKGQKDFAAKRKQAADRLVQQRLLLPEDAATISTDTLPTPTTSGETKP